MTYLDTFLAGWGRLSVDPAAYDHPVEARLLPLLTAIAKVERNTSHEARKAQPAGLFRYPDLAEFLPIWEAEESEHGRTITKLLGSNAEAQDDASDLRSLRNSAGLMMLMAIRFVPGIDLAFCATAASAEFLTITAYHYLTAHASRQEHREVYLAIGRQEGRHMRFYLAAAKARATSYGQVQCWVARTVLRRCWSPVGVGCLGLEGWTSAFQLLLEDQDFMTRTLKMDRMMDEVIPLRGLGLMERFLKTIPSAHGTAASSA